MLFGWTLAKIKKKHWCLWRNTILTSKVENKRLYARQMVVLPPNNVLLCSGGGSLFGEWIGNGHLLQWSSRREGEGGNASHGSLHCSQAGQGCRLAGGQSCGGAGAREQARYIPSFSPLPLPLPTSLFCLPASVLPQFPPPFSTLCCAVQLLSNVQNHPALVRLKCHASMQGRI